MTPTLATPTTTATEPATCAAALDRVISGPWTAGAMRQSPVSPPLPATSAEDAPVEWYARPLVVATAVTGFCAAFWAAMAFAASALF